MNTLWCASVFAGLVLGAQLLQAQQPDSNASKERGARSMMMNQGMRQMAAMDSMNARLDTLVGRMNRTKGNAKVTAMAHVVNELVAQRKAMQEHMRQMMQSRSGMMDMKTELKPAETAKPKAGTDSVAADTAGHVEHHP